MVASHSYFADVGLLQLAGVAGVVLYIYGFSAVQFNWLRGSDVTYSLVNVLAASLVAISLIEDFNLAAALVQGSWILIGLTGLALRLRKSAFFTAATMEPSPLAGDPS